MENGKQDIPFPQPGQAVHIIDGPFTDFDGTVERVNEAERKVLVAVNFFGRMTPVLLPYSQIEPLDDSHPRPF